MGHPPLTPPVQSDRLVAVIGAGIIGASIAWRLAQRGWNVTLFEQGEWGREASWAGAGMLAPGGEIDETSELLAMAQRSRRLYGEFVGELEKASGQPIDYQENGALDLAYSPEEWQALRARGERQTALGIASKVMTPNRVAAFWPFVRQEGLEGSLFYPNDAVVNPRDVLRALRIVCAQSGVKIQERHAVTLLDQISPRQIRVWSNEDSADFRAAVLAAGAWSGSVALAGIPAISASEPVKGHLLGYQLPQKYCQTIVRHGHTYVLQRSNGFLIVGSNMERVGFDRSVQPGIVTELQSAGNFILPDLSETVPSEVWTGFRPGSDGLHVGRWQQSSLYLAYGHLRNGLLLAPATAEKISGELAEAFY